MNSISTEATLVYKFVYLQHLVQNLVHNKYSTDCCEMSEMISILSAYFASCISFKPHSHPVRGDKTILFLR